VDIVAHLFSFVSEYTILFAFEVAFHEIGKEAVQLHAGVVGASEATAAQAASRHVEIAAVFLHHHVGGDLGGAEERVFGLVDGERLGDAVGKRGVGIIPTGLELLERDPIGGIAVDLVGAHVHKGRLGAGLPGGFQHIQGADGIGIKIVEGNRRRAVVRGLRRRMHNHVGLHGLEQVEHAAAVADIDLVMFERGKVLRQALLIPARVALGTEKYGPLVVVDPMNGVAQFAGKVGADLGADKPG